MKKFVPLIILLAFVLPVSTNAAEDSDLEGKIDELNAMVEYLEITLNVDQPTLTDQQMKQVIVDATTWLIAAQEEDGHFAYEYDPFADKYLDDDNIVRQAGALYQLGEVVRRDKAAVPDLADAIESSISYFESLSREDEFLGVNFRCIANSEISNRCKLGATSLALIGIISYVEAYPEKEAKYSELIKDYANYIANSKELNQGFRNVHRIGDFSQPRKESSFSNGEALLALTRYHLLFDNSTAKEVIDDTFTYLKEQPFDSPLYLWIMAALKDLVTMDEDVDGEHAKYAKYAKEFTNWRVDGIALHKKTRKNYCAYAEGIASAYSVLAPTMTEAEETKLRSEIDYWNGRNSRLQVTDELRYQNVDGELELLATPNFEQARGGFLTSQDALTQRIDFTQHCISSYLQTLVDIDGETL